MSVINSNLENGSVITARKEMRSRKDWSVACWEAQSECSEDRFSGTKPLKMREVLKEGDRKLWAPWSHSCGDSPVAWPCQGTQAQAEAIGLALDPCLSVILRALLVALGQISKSWQDRYLSEDFGIPKIMLNNAYLRLPVPKILLTAIWTV